MFWKCALERRCVCTFKKFTISCLFLVGFLFIYFCVFLEWALLSTVQSKRYDKLLTNSDTTLYY